jgi:hypothetical protein
MRHTVSFSLAATLVIASSSCGLLMMRPPRSISDYCGDGTIAPLKNPVNPGWKVDFESFSLARAVSVRYKLDCLPKTWWHNGYEAGLVVELTPTEDHDWPQMPTSLTFGLIGTLTLRLYDHDHQPLFDSQAEVATLSWSRRYDDQPVGGIRWTPTKYSPWSYVPEQKEALWELPPLVLEVDYKPGPQALDRPARIRFQMGGSE